MARVRKALASAPAPLLSPHENPSASASAVLIAIYDDGNEAWMVLTRRANHMRAHRGEVSFPGGRRHGDEDLTNTATREAQEEIGLDPLSVEIIAELDHLATVSSAAYIVPFVGVLPGRPDDLRPNPSEVDRILNVAFSELLHTDVFHEELWRWEGQDRPISFFDLEGDTLWGATATIVRNLMALVLDSP